MSKEMYFKLKMKKQITLDLVNGIFLLLKNIFSFQWMKIMAKM